MKLDVTTRCRVSIELISLAALALGCAAAPKSAPNPPPNPTPAASEPEFRVEENDAVITGFGSIPSRSSAAQRGGAAVEIWAQSFHLEGHSGRTLREAKPDSHFSGLSIVPVYGDVRDFAIEFSDARDRAHPWPLEHVAVSLRITSRVDRGVAKSIAFARRSRNATLERTPTVESER